MIQQAVLWAGITAVFLSGMANCLAQPNVTRQPLDQSVSLGANASFQVSASSTTPIRYQWRLGGTDLPGQTNSSVTITDVQVGDAGDYDVVLTESSGSSTSHPAHLEVDPTFTKITTGPVVTSGGFGFGCAWGDYDNDGFPDLFVCNFPDSTGTQHDFLFHNRGNGSFERITSVLPVNAQAWATAATWGDYDNDGKLDLFVTRPGNSGVGRNTLYHNDGHGGFTPITTGLLVTQLLTSHAGIWSDIDNDGLIDLVVANFRHSGAIGAAADNYLYHNNGNGNFQRISFGSKTVLNGDSFDVAASDFNDDGWPDLVIAQGATYNPQNMLPYINAQNGIFDLLTNSAIFSNLASGAGVAWGDYDNDGFPDLFISTNPESVNRLYHNNGDGSFTLVTNSVIGTDIGNSAGCAWGDYDNDGWLDLFVARVGKYDNNFNIVARESNILYHNNRDGTFTKVTSGSLVNEPGISFGAAWGDYDNDGFLDLFVSNGFVSADADDFLFRNNGNTNNWINFRLVGTVSNRAAIGAKVRVLATIYGRKFWQLREISGGSGHGCQNDLRANFGLGDATNADLVRIEWPSGVVQTLTNLHSKQFLTITEHQEGAAAPSIVASLSRATDGVVQLSAAGPQGFRYLLEASTNLHDWVWLASRTNLSATVQWTDWGVTNVPSRFYRVSVP
jgi:hypothetical protein